MAKKKKARLRVGSAYKLNDWIVLEGINAAYNTTTKHFVFNILGQGFSTLPTKTMQEFLDQLVFENKD